MDLLQYTNFTQFLYGRIESTDQLPHPQITWLGVGANQIQAAWDAAGVDAPDLETAHLDNSIAGLIYVLTYYKRNAPNLTRNFHQQIGDFLEAPARVAKTNRIMHVFPNTHGDNGASDPFESLQECISNILSGAQYLNERYARALIWVNDFRDMKSRLATTKGLIPRVAIGTTSRAVLMENVQQLIESQDRFWSNYSEWISTRITSLTNVMTLYRGITEHNNITFANQMLSVENQNYMMLLVYRNERDIIADNIDGISNVYENITRALSDVTNTKESSGDKNQRTLDVILTDINALVDKMANERTTMRHGERQCLIEESNNILRRIDNAREMGVSIDISHKDRVTIMKSNLLGDQRQEEIENKKLESIEKARINESIKSAPPVNLQPLKGFQNWLSYYAQAKEVLSNISNEQTKATIVYRSLTSKEDKEHLKGVMSMSVIMKYLTDRYNRPDELVACVLSKGTSLPIAGHDDSVMKQNILVLLTIERDLKKFGCVAKIDSFFISQIRLRVLTDGEHKRYLREKAQYDLDSERKSRRAARAQTAHRNANRSALDLTELDDAAGDRNISGDEEDPDSSDTESEASNATAKWS